MPTRTRWLAKTGAASIILLVVSFVVATANSGQSKPTTPDEKPFAGPVHASPPLDDRKQLGITHPAWASDEYDLPASQQMIPEIAASGANWIVLTPTWYQPNATSSVVTQSKDDSVTDPGVRRAIDAAHTAGLHVMLKPHVDLPDDTDRATIQPKNVDGWFQSYTAMIDHYAQMAQATGVQQLAVGTELAGTSTNTDKWRAVIASVRSRYSGKLTYAANYDEYEQIQFWDALDYVGIDAYWPLADAPTSDVNALVGAWQPIATKLKDLSHRLNKQILFTEAGYPSQSSAAVEPYNWEGSTTRDDAAQAAGYEALARVFWNQPWFAGVHWWMWDDIPDRTDDNQALDYTPHGKPAEEVLRRLAHS